MTVQNQCCHTETALCLKHCKYRHNRVRAASFLSLLPHSIRSVAKWDHRWIRVEQIWVRGEPGCEEFTVPLKKKKKSKIALKGNKYAIKTDNIYHIITSQGCRENLLKRVLFSPKWIQLIQAHCCHLPSSRHCSCSITPVQILLSPLWQTWVSPLAAHSSYRVGGPGD